ncbi:MAG: nucleotide exchange factor GrpE [Flavobacteriaceae bacterium]|nr:nucleotide exchange factor GrpE [Flavobacteriaceae bacterium]
MSTAKKTENKDTKSTKKKAKPAVKKTAASKAEKALTEANEALTAEKDKFLRLFAEFENYKKRTSKERIELFKTAGQEVISSMLPVVDDFNRAFTEAEKQENSADFEGFRLISNKLNETLKSKGLVAIEVNAGDAFDAEKHEAITQIPAGEDQSGKIIDVTEQGYQLGEKIIRYPKVVVGQ